MSKPTREPATSLRVRSPAIGLGAIALVLMTPGFAVAVTAADSQAWLRASAAVLGVLLVVSMVLVASANARATVDGLKVRRPFGRTRQLTWEQIHHFEIRGYWRVLGLHTAAGGWVRLVTYGAFDAESLKALSRLEIYRRHRQ